MLIKWLRRKMLESMINELINQLPNWKMSAKILFLEKKNEILDKAEKAVINAVKKIFEKEFGE